MKESLFFTLIFVLFLNSCISQDPKDVNLHADECTYCKMVISDQQFVSQLVSDKGKSYPFDSIECMAAYAYQTPEVSKSAKLYATDYTRLGEWLPLEQADIYHGENVPSPMGLSLLALPLDQPVPDDLDKAKKMTWSETIDYVVNQWNVKK